MIYTLADFGSTFTKVSVVDTERAELLASAQHPTTVNTDVSDGFVLARRAALAQAGCATSDRTLATSSAAGGLRMVAIGLVDDLTAAAARRSALRAGARVEAVFSGRLGPEVAPVIRHLAPDVILFGGGTDGGERRQVLANARAIAGAAEEAAVVVACNREVAEEVASEFRRGGHETVIVENLLPRVDLERSGPARGAIRALFIHRVVRAKGLSRAEEFFDSILMPTPAAVLACAELLATGATEQLGCGSVLLVDVGGATTDVHSVISEPAAHMRLARGRPAPERSARSVEGDLGVRWNADGVYAQDRAWIERRLAMAPADIRAAVAKRTQHPSYTPETEAERDVDRALAASCITAGVERHVGRLSTRYVPGEGAELMLDGRDLREVPFVLVTGGSIAHDTTRAEASVRDAFSRLDDHRPVPDTPRVLIDHNYVVAAAGLLSIVEPDAAMSLLEHAVPGLGAALSVSRRRRQPSRGT